jgi:hypothetical protein
MNRLELTLTPEEIASLRSPKPHVQALLRVMRGPWHRMTIQRKPCGKKNTKR